MDWAQILVIILAIFLALFLLLGIILVGLLIKLTHQIRAVTSTAQRTAEQVERAVAGFAKVSSPALLLKTLMKQAKKFKKNHKEEDTL